MNNFALTPLTPKKKTPHKGSIRAFSYSRNSPSEYFRETLRQRLVGNTKLAILKCELYLQYNHEDPRAHAILGELYEEQGNTEQALRSYRTCLSLQVNSDSVQVELRLARLLVAQAKKTLEGRQRHLAEAKNLLNRLFNTNLKDDKEVLYLYLDVLQEQGESAVEFTRKVAELNTGDIEFHIKLLQILEKDHVIEALRHHKKCTPRFKNNLNWWEWALLFTTNHLRSGDESDDECFSPGKQEDLEGCVDVNIQHMRLLNITAADNKTRLLIMGNTPLQKCIEMCKTYQRTLEQLHISDFSGKDKHMKEFTQRLYKHLGFTHFKHGETQRSHGKNRKAIAAYCKSIKALSKSMKEIEKNHEDSSILQDNIDRMQAIRVSETGRVIFYILSTLSKIEGNINNVFNEMQTRGGISMNTLIKYDSLLVLSNPEDLDLIVQLATFYVKEINMDRILNHWVNSIFRNSDKEIGWLPVSYREALKQGGFVTGLSHYKKTSNKNPLSLTNIIWFLRTLIVDKEGHVNEIDRRLWTSLIHYYNHSTSSRAGSFPLSPSKRVRGGGGGGRRREEGRGAPLHRPLSVHHIRKLLSYTTPSIHLPSIEDEVLQQKELGFSHEKPKKREITTILDVKQHKEEKEEEKEKEKDEREYSELPPSTLNVFTTQPRGSSRRIKSSRTPIPVRELTGSELETLQFKRNKMHALLHRLSTLREQCDVLLRAENNNTDPVNVKSLKGVSTPSPTARRKLMFSKEVQMPSLKDSTAESILNDFNAAVRSPEQSRPPKRGVNESFLSLSPPVIPTTLSHGFSFSSIDKSSPLVSIDGKSKISTATPVFSFGNNNVTASSTIAVKGTSRKGTSIGGNNRGFFIAPKPNKKEEKQISEGINGWKCPACETDNLNTASHCEVCSGTRPGASTSHIWTKKVQLSDTPKETKLQETKPKSSSGMPPLLTKSDLSKKMPTFGNDETPTKSTDTFSALKSSTSIFSTPKSSTSIFSTPKSSSGMPPLLTKSDLSKKMPTFGDDETPTKSTDTFSAPKSSTSIFSTPKSSSGMPPLLTKSDLSKKMPTFGDDKMPTKSTDTFSAPKSSTSTFSTPKSSSDTFSAPKSSSDTFNTPKSSGGMPPLLTKSDLSKKMPTFGEPKETKPTDTFSAPKSSTSIFSTPKSSTSTFTFKKATGSEETKKSTTKFSFGGTTAKTISTPPIFSGIPSTFPKYTTPTIEEKKSFTFKSNTDKMPSQQVHDVDGDDENTSYYSVDESGEVQDSTSEDSDTVTEDDSYSGSDNDSDEYNLSPRASGDEEEEYWSSLDDSDKEGSDKDDASSSSEDEPTETEEEKEKEEEYAPSDDDPFVFDSKKAASFLSGGLSSDSTSSFKVEPFKVSSPSSFKKDSSPYISHLSNAPPVASSSSFSFTAGGAFNTGSAPSFTPPTSGFSFTSSNTTGGGGGGAFSTGLGGTCNFSAGKKTNTASVTRRRSRRK